MAADWTCTPDMQDWRRLCSLQRIHPCVLEAGTMEYYCIHTLIIHSRLCLCVKEKYLHIWVWICGGDGGLYMADWVGSMHTAGRNTVVCCYADSRCVLAAMLVTLTQSSVFCHLWETQDGLMRGSYERLRMVCHVKVAIQLSNSDGNHFLNHYLCAICATCMIARNITWNTLHETYCTIKWDGEELFPITITIYL